MIGEDPTKPFANIMPYIAQVAIGHKPFLTIYGGDYNTPDGTGKNNLKSITNSSLQRYSLQTVLVHSLLRILGIRDYIHVMDLATGHVAALDMLYRKHQHLKASVTGMSFTSSFLDPFLSFPITALTANTLNEPSLLGVQPGNWTRSICFATG